MDGPENTDAIKNEDAERPQMIGVPGLVSLAVIGFLTAISVKAQLRLGILIPSLIIANLAHLGAFYILGRLCGIGILRFDLFFGNAVLRFRDAETWISIGWIPGGGSVKFLGFLFDDPNAPPSKPPSVARRQWTEMPTLARIGILLSGPVATLILAMAAIGPASALQYFAKSPFWFFELVLGSKSVSLWQRFFQFVDSAPFVTTLGFVSVWMAFTNLLPLPIMNGGQALVEACSAIHKIPQRTQVLLQYASLVVVLWVSGISLYGAVRAW
jgi:membrane-associated protease RseP (regulator of RpoE activity)